MKKITFKINKPEIKNISYIIKELNSIACQMQIDFEHGTVIVQDIDSNKIVNKVVDLVNSYFTIVAMEIDNIASTNKDEELSKNNVIDMESEILNTGINKILKTIRYAVKGRNVAEDIINKHIISFCCEISGAYNGSESVDFKLGEVVECEYGRHYPGESNGGRVYAVVCDISKNGMAYVVPIYKFFEERGFDCMKVTATKDVEIYATDIYYQGMAVLEQAKYVSTKRFRCVVGKANPKFFNELLERLATKYNFAKDITEVEEKQLEVKSEESKKIVRKVAKNKHLTKNEATLRETIIFAIEKLDSSKTAEEQIVSFLDDIGMSKNEKVVKNAFIIACKLKRITNKNVMDELCKKHRTTKETQLTAIMQRTFKKWLEEQYPELKEKCYKISFMDLLKVFARELNK